MRTVYIVLLIVSNACPGAVAVTSQEQFKRQKVDSSPDSANYNFERAYLEVRANESCPVHSKGFFFLHISREGEVDTVRGRLVAYSRDLRALGVEYAKALLKQLHFRPLLYGNKPTAVEMALTLVCTD